MPNRLSGATSPYLLQHKDNPVDWWPWCDEAFEEAKRRDIPVLLSIGYAACHWCHVMAHESFEDPAIAAQMNDHFICIKVDREERPDVDAVYMDAVQALTGHGGWPMTTFLTADGAPFHAGTYLPPTDRHGMPGFPRVLSAVTEAWRTRRDAIDAAGREIVSRLAEVTAAPRSGGRPLDGITLDAGAASLVADHDTAHGGFGGAPKFPPAMCLEFLLRHHARTGSAAALAVVTNTTDRMARGGIYDQLGGGFARYSVDASWTVPHFEKMLSDNALLLRVYTHVWRVSGDRLARRVAEETAGFLLAELRTEEGGFASSLDADSDGGEGRFYVWTPDQLGAVLGADGPAAARLFAVTSGGTFEHGSSVLQLPVDPADPDWFASVRSRLVAARDTRPRPARDDKVVAAWNGLAIAALVDAGLLFGRSDFVDAATAAARLVTATQLIGGRLRRTSRAGRAGTDAGVLEDYADLADGLLAVHQATGEAHWLEVAGRLLDVVLSQFRADDGGFYDTAADAERLIRRPRDVTDNATPAGGSAAAGALLGYAALTGEDEYRAAAESALALVAPLVERQPRFAAAAAAVGEALLAGPLEIAVIGRPDLVRIARRTPSPGAVVVTEGDSPLLVDRGAGAAYICRHFVCAAPITDPAALAVALGVTLDSPTFTV
ncbi:MAG TPA: thioredoxin domain-containing protein [Mycobacteriales bacterium]|nr:thioredoxin domain-containing protein [Mycobacteriales bacterium]